jgi:hypothetical protein
LCGFAQGTHHFGDGWRQPVNPQSDGFVSQNRQSIARQVRGFVSPRPQIERAAGGAIAPQR